MTHSVELTGPENAALIRLCEIVVMEVRDKKNYVEEARVVEGILEVSKMPRIDWEKLFRKLQLANLSPRIREKFLASESYLQIGENSENISR